MIEEEMQEGLPDEEINAEVPEGADVEQHEPEVPEAPQWDDEDAKEARLFGWKAPDEWKGDKPDGYIDNPGDYLRRVQGSKIFKTMQEKIEAQASASTEAARKLEEMNRRALELQASQYESKMSEIVSRQRKAVTEMDEAAFDAAERDRLELMKSQPAKSQAEAPKPDPAVSQYREAHEWAKNPAIWQEAVQAVNVGLSHGVVAPSDTAAQLEYAENIIRQKYPHMFKAEEKPKPRQRVEGGGLATAAPRTASAYDKLPGDAKTQFKRFVEQGVFSDTKEDREEYANDYNAA